MTITLKTLSLFAATISLLATTTFASASAPTLTILKGSKLSQYQSLDYIRDLESVSGGGAFGPIQGLPSTNFDMLISTEASDINSDIAGAISSPTHSWTKAKLSFTFYTEPARAGTALPCDLSSIVTNIVKTQQSVTLHLPDDCPK